MSEVQPQPGDKVLVRYRPREIHATVDSDGLYPGMDDVEDGRADVKIVEHADPSGTVRGDRYICLEPGKLYGWWDFRMSEWALADVARTEPVTGAVPGTPAAQAQREKDDADREREFKALGASEPLVVQYGDPEPDTRRTYRSPNGATVQMGTFGWRVVGTNGDTFINVPWTAIRAEFFPLTEVVGP